MPAPDEILAREPWRSKLLDVAGLALRLRWRHGDLKDESREVTDALLAAFLATVRSIGARPVVVHLPANDDVASDAPSPREDEVAVLCRAQDVPFLSLRERFHRAIPDNPLGRASHWNASTHDVAADEIAEFVRREHLLEPDERSREGAPSR